MATQFNLQINFLEFFTQLGLDFQVTKIIWLLICSLSVVIVAVLGVLVIVWLERKISAAAQQRIGPEFAGPLGLLQSLADGLKLVAKEEVIPAKGDSLLYILEINEKCSFIINNTNKEMIITDEQEKEFKKSTHCYLCL